jgi:hypothetical protein
MNGAMCPKCRMTAPGVPACRDAQCPGRTGLEQSLRAVAPQVAEMANRPFRLLGRTFNPPPPSLDKCHGSEVSS